MSEEPPRGRSFFEDSQSSGSEVEAALRPPAFEDFTGQPKTIDVCRSWLGLPRNGKKPSSMFYCGPPGLGKTTLAHIIGHELQREVRITSGPVIDKPGDLAGLLTNLQGGDILFIDEIHRIPKTVEEYLYSAMEDFRIDIMIDQGPNARSVRLEIPRFTLIGATTRVGLLSASMRSRFTLQTRLDYYGRSDLTKIVLRSCKLLDCPIDQAGAKKLPPVPAVLPELPIT